MRDEIEWRRMAYIQPVQQYVVARPTLNGQI